MPDDLYVASLSKSNLPDGWNGLSNYTITQSLGAKWLSSRDSCVLKVPSSIVIHEYNYILNVHHADFDRLKIVGVEDYLYDPRLLDKMR